MHRAVLAYLCIQAGGSVVIGTLAGLYADSWPVGVFVALVIAASGLAMVRYWGP